MKYAVIATYTSGEATGAVVSAEERPEAWRKALELFGNGARLQSIQLNCILTPERGGESDEEDL